MERDMSWFFLKCNRLCLAVASLHVTVALLNMLACKKPHTAMLNDHTRDLLI